MPLSVLIFPQVVDYEANAPVYQYLAKQYSHLRFDCVIDAFGVQEFYVHCHQFLTEGKPFVTVGPAFREYSSLSLLFTVSIYPMV